MRKARVFISCGQRTDKEKSIGKEVEKFFKKQGFLTYFAERIHSPEALTENIFRFLKRSEYFVFIDFKREAISPERNRGSLFVNQEIALAAFLKLPSLGFQERGAAREGILDCQIFNAIPFEDGTQILAALEKEFTGGSGWDNGSVNELALSYDASRTTRNIILDNHPARPITDWYHLTVHNRNRSKHAHSCHAYISNLKDLGTNTRIEIPTNELIWAGIGDISVNIMGGSSRDLDAFYLMQNENQIVFNARLTLTDNPKYNLPVLKPGKYIIEYAIVSSNFETASRQFRLSFQSPQQIGFEEISQQDV